MYLRFTVTEIDDNSRREKGVISAAYELLDSGDLGAEEHVRLRELMDWFEKNLPNPPDDFYASRAIFWFRSDAKENIDRIWEVILILRENGYHVNVLKCQFLANVSFRDRFQVASYPSARDSSIIKT